MSEENNQEQKEVTKKTTKKRPVKKVVINNDLPKDEDGNIDWLKMIPEKFIVPQDKMKKDIPVSQLENHEKMVLLGGWKYLLKKRGYISKHDFIHESSTEFVSATCRIVWTAHEDSNGIEQTYESSADAHLGNTDGMMKKFLTANAQNRAFARCVREYLNIHVVGKDETDKATIEEMINQNKNNSSNNISYARTPQEGLKNLLLNNGFNLKYAIKWFKDEKKSNNILSVEEIDAITDWNDIPLSGCYALINAFEEWLKTKRSE